ncbi:MAG: peptidase MA family metallohydrolase [Nitrospirota bacterium]|nr:peptidase MA family metallohydrolase [Nitrospirota bacterium]
MSRGLIVILLLLGVLWLLAPPARQKERPPQGDRMGFLNEKFDPFVLPGGAGSTVDPIARADADTEAADALREGQRLLQAGNPGAAVAMFEKAAAGGIWEAALGLAESYRESRESDLALEIIHEAAIDHGDDPRVWMLMGEIYFGKGEFALAIDAWETVMKLRPTPELADRIRQTQVEMNLRDRYRDDLSRHFAPRFEGPVLDRTVHDVAKALEDAYLAVGLELGYYPTERTEVVLYTEESFYDVTRAPSWAEGVYDGVIRLPAVGAESDLDTLRRVAVHEYAHAVVTGLAGEKAPSWVQEGVAMNMESVPPPYTWARDTLLAEDVVPLTAEELGTPFGGLAEEQVSLAYAESYVVFQYLLAHYGTYKVHDMLRAMNDESVEDAMDRAFDIDLQTAIDLSMQELRSKETPGWQRS